MGFDPDKLLHWPFPEIEQTYTVKDAILYALGVGFGSDPLDRNQLRFCYEGEGFQAAPTMAATLAWPGFWMQEPGIGIDWRRVLHGEQGIEIHRPLPPSTSVKGQFRIIGIFDKGTKGALIHTERKVTDKATGAPLTTLTATLFARGNGGFGGESGPPSKPHTLPDRAPDMQCDLPTASSSALLYRLSGDPNPLHIDPDVALAAGFKAPILHGLCTLGVAGHAILRSFCNYDATRFRSMRLRFSNPVYPGETIRTEMWQDGNVVSFRSIVTERDLVVVDNGMAVIES